MGGPVWRGGVKKKKKFKRHLKVFKSLLYSALGYGIYLHWILCDALHPTLLSRVPGGWNAAPTAPWWKVQ